VIFERIVLRNFKPYGDAAVDLSEGVTVVHGLNGSGKSSLLEACFFALYGARALDGTLSDVITNGVEETDVELWFSHDGRRFHVTREVRTHGDRASTATCTLETDDGGVVRDGATDVRAFVTDLLRMDAEAFVNCAYVRQGEVNELIEASPSARQDTIDDLLQLGRLEEYRDRAGQARLGVEDVLEGRRGALENLDDRIERKEAKDLPERLNQLESTVGEVDDDIDQYETEREKAVATRDDARDTLATYEDRRGELSAVDAEIDALETEIRESETERREVESELAAARDRRSEAETALREAVAESDVADGDPETVRERRATLDERESRLRERLLDARDEVTDATNRAEERTEAATERRERAAEERERAETLASKREEDRERLTELRERREQKAAERDRLQAAFTDAPVEVGGAASLQESIAEDRSELDEEIEDVRTDLKEARSAVERGEELLAAGNCPECGQPVADSPHVDALDDRRERVDRLETQLTELRADREALTDRRERAEELREVERDLDAVEDTLSLLDDRITEVEGRIEDRGEQIQQHERRAAELESDAETAAADAETAAEAAAAARERVAECNRELASVSETTDRLDRIDDCRTDREQAAAEIDRLEERRDGLETLNDQRRDSLAAKRARREELAAAVDDEAVAAARERLDKAESYIERADQKLSDLRDRRDDLTNQIGAVTNELDELEQLRGEREAVAEDVSALESLREETADLADTYASLRAELRQRHVDALETRLNETFELVYGNDAYSHIELDDSYELTVYQKNGEPLEPAQLSGGERALFNLSLRCGIYRLLAEGVEGAAPTPPLILDEPTVFLDDGHVGRLVDLVEQMRGFGVAQILIVSHDDELVDAADDLVRVEKNPTTNRSSVERIENASVAELREPADD
jgi:ATPase involved in DNA repair